MGPWTQMRKGTQAHTHTRTQMKGEDRRAGANPIQKHWVLGPLAFARAASWGVRTHPCPSDASGIEPYDYYYYYVYHYYYYY